MTTAFHGVRILDFTRFLAGPFGTHQFALQGADVIKVESLEGDDIRTVAVDKALSRQKMSPTFMAMNTDKRSIAVDLRQPEGIALIKQLIAEVDIVWENFRPGVMAQMGLDYPTLAKLHPRLIYCSVSGFGQTGPESGTAAFDGKIQAMSGVMSITGDPASGPMRAGFAVCDLVAAMTASFAVSAALYQRTHTGRGQHVDVAMLDSTLNFLSAQVGEFTVSGRRQRQFGNLSVSRKVTANRFRAGSGDIVLAALTEKQFANLMRAVGHPEALEDSRFADWFTRTEHEPALRALIEGGMASHDPVHWERVLTAADVPCAVVLAIDEIIHHPQVRHRGLLQEIEGPLGKHTLVGAGFRFAHGNGGIRRPAPLLGEHTAEVLREAGFSNEAIDQLAQQGVILPGAAVLPSHA
ncbi:MAG: CaiB/BaiF CoA transferase family protein [Pigmentiphaga sp.]